MKIYDKAQWHIDAGESKEKVLKKFEVIFSFLHEHNLLSEDGIEVWEIGIDESISLHERLLTQEGNMLLDLCYDKLIVLEVAQIREVLAAAFR